MDWTKQLFQSVSNPSLSAGSDRQRRPSEASAVLPPDRAGSAWALSTSGRAA
jgi:hypothetical protein